MDIPTAVESSHEHSDQASQRRRRTQGLAPDLGGVLVHCPGSAEFFGREPCKGVHPDEVVALGASIQGSALLDENTDILLLDVTPHSLGIMVAGGKFHRIIEQNTTVPTSATQQFTTVRDNQTSVRILVMQGESDQAEENELLGEFVLTGLRRAPKGEVEVDVTFAISADGIVNVSAKDVETGKEQSITVTATSGLTEEEIQEMMQESRDQLVAQKQDDEKEERLGEAEANLRELERLMPKVREVISASQFGHQALERAEGLITRLKSAIEEENVAAIEELDDSIRRTLNMFKGVVAKTGL